MVYRLQWTLNDLCKAIPNFIIPLSKTKLKNQVITNTCNSNYNHTRQIINNSTLLWVFFVQYWCNYHRCNSSTFCHISQLPINIFFTLDMSNGLQEEFFFWNVALTFFSLHFFFWFAWYEWDFHVTHFTMNRINIYKHINLP